MESVYNSKIPDLMEVMEEARASNLGRFDAEALRLEGEILRIARQLKSHCRRIARERSFGVLRGTFNSLWSRLNDLFRQFLGQCLYLGISLSDIQCLALTDDETSSSEDDESSSSEEEEVDRREE